MNQVFTECLRTFILSTRNYRIPSFTTSLYGTEELGSSRYGPITLGLALPLMRAHSLSSF